MGSAIGPVVPGPAGPALIPCLVTSNYHMHCQKLIYQPTGIEDFQLLSITAGSYTILVIEDQQ